MLLSNGSTTIKFNNKSKNRDYNIYVEEYFGGSDVFVYVNGQRLHNIAHIQYAIQERHKPVYGYGSRTFDDVAVGDRIVVGAMKIPVSNTEVSVPNQRSVDTQSTTSNARSVPSWVYNSTIEGDTLSEDNIETQTFISEANKLISSIQKYYSIPITGVMDFNTQVTVMQDRLRNGLHPGCYCNDELLDKMNKEEVCCYALGRINLYAEPTFDNNIKVLPSSAKLVILAHNEDAFLVRYIDGFSGYVKREEVVFDD